MILSIGMIVKNEERTLRDCLNAIKPLLEQVDSELIIADTGSIDNTIAIAKDFTDNVYEIQWTDDFSAARNTTLAQATGEWYMYLDADEVFEDVSDIIRFFNSGEYKAYESARHLRRESKGELCFNFERLFKRYEHTKFINTIHEGIPTNGPQKMLDSVSIHYDARYLSEGDEERKYKHYMHLLLKAYKENPLDDHIVFNLVRETLRKGSYSDAREYIDAGLKIFSKDLSDPLYHFLAAMSIMCYYREKEYEKTIEAARGYFEKTSIIAEWAIILRVHEASACLKLDKLDEADDAFRKALHLWDKNQRGELDDFNLSEALALKVDEKTKTFIVTHIVKHCLTKGNLDEAINICETYKESLGDISAEHFTSSFEKHQFNSASLLCHYAANKFEIDSNDYNMLIFLIENSIKNSDIKLRLAEYLSKEGVGEDYIRLQEIRKGNLNEINYFLSSRKSYPNFYADIIVAAMQLRLDFSDFIDRMNIVGENALIVNLIATNYNIADLLVPFLNNNQWYYNCTSIKTIRILYMLCERCISIAEPPKNIQVFETYIRIYGAYLSYVYKADIYDESSLDAFPEHIGFVYYAHIAYMCKDKNDINGFASNLRKAIQRDKSMNNIVAAIVGALQQAPQSSPEQQLKNEAIRLKSIIESLIQSGSIEQAKAILGGYEQIMPSDPDIANLKERLAGN